MICRSPAAVGLVLAGLAISGYPPQLSDGLAAGPRHHPSEVAPSPDRKTVERRAETEISSWERQLSSLSAQGPEQQRQADHLSQHLSVVKQQWEALKGTNDADWPSRQAAYEATREEFLGKWQQVATE